MSKMSLLSTPIKIKSIELSNNKEVQECTKAVLSVLGILDQNTKQSYLWKGIHEIDKALIGIATPVDFEIISQPKDSWCVLKKFINYSWMG